MSNSFKLIDPHIHMSSRTTDDYVRIAERGITAVVEPAFWSGCDKRYAGSFFDYFRLLTSFEKNRAAKYGIKHFCSVGVNPKEANNKALAHQVIDELNEYIKTENVVAIGEIGFDKITAEEEEIFRRQLDIAEENTLPVIIHTPHTNKAAGVRKICEIIEEMKLSQERILIDHNTEDTIEMTLSLSVWAGHTVYPDTKLTPERAVAIFKKYGIKKMLVNSSADWGHSDPLAVYNTAKLMQTEGFSKEEITTLVFDNPNEFFSQSAQWKI